METEELAQSGRISGPRIASIVVNAVDAARLSSFWSVLLDMPVSAEYEGFIWLRPAESGLPQLAFQQVAAPTEGRRRLHLDLHDADPSALRRKAETLGATFVEEYTIGDFHWDVMQDPEGNEFCIARD
ncbi:VOC family protein [Arthrobacter sp. ISL-95]|uniref:VOC family protein n=1 Tax=Arthrobacter sp. ISL-95 TaxID=2819116 RepID=UPI001BE66407|nr:VOC family protein [Arthrobacter sp. ISL-95]MBT2588026.1 VOC family protein [Arthrobacter sp. ISL-95]